MSASLDELATLVVKDGVALGRLTPRLRELALSVPAWALPADAEVSETDVNAILRAALRGPASFLDTDHVELRRWLVDTGWWQRDGFGRAYARTPSELLPARLQAVARELIALDLAVWVTSHRDREVARRESRRAAFADRQPPAAQTGRD